jgi:uncharacterized protein YkwD
MVKKSEKQFCRYIHDIINKMMDFLSHLFIPKESNNHRAKILHHTNLFLSIIFLLLASFFLQTVKAKFPSVLGIKEDVSSEQLLLLTNKERQNVGVNSLVLNNKLSDAASRKAQDMFDYNYWAHNSPTGKTPWVFISAAGYKYVYAGENLARGFSTADAVIKAWMASPDHRANMLSSNYRDVGFAVKVGKLTGEDTVLIVEEFGNLAMPFAKNTKSQKISAVKSTKSIPKNVQAISKQPLINTSSLSSNIYYVFVVVFIFALFLDMIIIEKKKVMRFVGHNVDHILYLLLVLILVGIWSRGVVI